MFQKEPGRNGVGSKRKAVEKTRHRTCGPGKGAGMPRAPYSRLLLILTLLSTPILAACEASLDARQTGTEQLYMETERVPINNCSGPASVTVYREISKTFTHEVYIEAGAEVGLNIGVVSAELGERYGIRDGEAETRTVGVSLTAPAHSKVVYYLEWREVWAKGILYDPSTGETQGTFRVRKDINLRIVDSKNKGC